MSLLNIEAPPEVKGRVYMILDLENTEAPPRWVRAQTSAQAMRHVAKARYSASVAKVDDLARAAESGPVAVEIATGSEE